MIQASAINAGMLDMPSAVHADVSRRMSRGGSREMDEDNLEVDRVFSGIMVREAI